ncbi:MAG: histidine phosphatase family protein [Aliishimia sp.]
MTRTLILMRHAKSGWDNPELDDYERPLNERGQISARRMGHWLRTRGHVPEVAVSSSSQRTRETFAGLGFDCEVAFSVQLYHARAHTMLAALTVLTAKTVLMIGHNPGIADFAQLVVSRSPSHPKFEAYPSCATLVVTFEAEHWRSITWGQGTAIDFAVPRELADP